MKLFYFLIIFSLFLSFQTAFADCSINTTLRTGSKGADVECLQGKIGVVADGSFGRLTKAAVVAFQSTNGLEADGIVGRLSRAVLNAVMENAGNYPDGCTSTTGYSTKTGIKCDIKANISSEGSAGSVFNNNDTVTENTNNPNVSNTNLKNLDEFISAVVKVNRENGSSEEELKLFADTIRKTAMNSNIDYQKEFEKMLVKENQLSLNTNNPKPLSTLDKVIASALSFLGINPSVAYASATGIPFGGFLSFAFFCPYNASWMITVTLPSVPPKVYVLTYYPGTQAFASYNIPLTTSLLGTFLPPGVCVIPGGFVPIFIPTMGTITPVVGSSPL